MNGLFIDDQSFDIDDDNDGMNESWVSRIIVITVIDAMYYMSACLLLEWIFYPF